MSAATIAVDRATGVVEWAHDRLALTYEEIASALGTTGRTLERWRGGAAVPRRTNRKAVEKLDEVRFWLDAVFGDPASKDARTWLNTRLLDLNGKTPLELIKRGELDGVIEILSTFHGGAFI